MELLNSTSNLREIRFNKTEKKHQEMVNAVSFRILTFKQRAMILSNLHDDVGGWLVPRGTSEARRLDDDVAIYCLHCVVRVCDVFSVIPITKPIFFGYGILL